jgi:hypothetical protein
MVVQQFKFFEVSNKQKRNIHQRYETQTILINYKEFGFVIDIFETHFLEFVVCFSPYNDIVRIA